MVAKREIAHKEKNSKAPAAYAVQKDAAAVLVALNTPIEPPLVIAPSTSMVPGVCVVLQKRLALHKIPNVPIKQAALATAADVSVSYCPQFIPWMQSVANENTIPSTSEPR